MTESTEPMTGAEWLRIVKRLTVEFPRHPLPNDTINAWYETLAPLGADRVRAAVTAYIAEGHEFPPSSSGVLRKLAEPPRRSWDDACSELVKALRRYGSSFPGRPKPPPFDDPALQRLVEQRGWDTLCRLPITDDTTQYAQLRDAYRSAQDQVGYEIRTGALRALGTPMAGAAAVQAGVDIERSMVAIEQAAESSDDTVRQWLDKLREQTHVGRRLDEPEPTPDPGSGN
jgi:hypothetical protein